jgi:hypothetical protein
LAPRLAGGHPQLGSASRHPPAARRRRRWGHDDDWARLASEAEEAEKAEIEAEERAEQKAQEEAQARTRDRLDSLQHDEDGGSGGALSDYVHTDNDRLKAAILLGENDKVKTLLAGNPALDLEHDTRETAAVVKAGFFPSGTALMCAIFASNTEAIELLLAHGANPDMGGTDNRMSPSETAAFRADGKAMRALHMGGCDVTGYGAHGFSLLHLVAKSERAAGKPAACVRWLVTKVGMAVDTLARAPSDAWGKLEVKEDGAAPLMTPLMSAVAIHRQLPVVEVLLNVSVRTAVLLALLPACLPCPLAVLLALLRACSLSLVGRPHACSSPSLCCLLMWVCAIPVAAQHTFSSTAGSGYHSCRQSGPQRFAPRGNPAWL